MTIIDLIGEQLASSHLVVLNREKMAIVESELSSVTRHGTLSRGDLVEAEWRGRPIVIEQPAEDEFTVRSFEDRRELDLFVERRLGQYERMWDGCGCRIDYYEAPEERS